MHAHSIPKLLLLIYCMIIGTTKQQSFANGNQQYAIITTGNRHKSSNLNELKHVSRDADYSTKVSVRVSDILSRQAVAAAAATNNARGRLGSNLRASSQIKSTITDPQRAQIFVKPQSDSMANALLLPTKNSHSIVNDDRSWPPEHSQEFSRVDVRVLGERIDANALLHLKPSSTVSSIRKLRRILGSDLQSDWMSIDPPHNMQTQSSKNTRSMGLADHVPKPDQRLLKAVNELNFTILRTTQNDGLVYPVELTTEQVSAMKAWLLQRATCEMQYEWENLGPLFWPRWIKRGLCKNTHSCSWPTGMRCRPSGSRVLKLLRWVCQNGSDRERMTSRQRRAFPISRKRRDETTYDYRYSNGTEERRSKRVRRLIRKLSLTANGYHCEWSRYEYMVSDDCTCGCT